MKFEEAHGTLTRWLNEEIETPINLHALAVVLAGQQQPFAYFDPQTAQFRLAKPTKIEVPTTVEIKPIELYTMAQPAPLAWSFPKNDEGETGWTICVKFMLEIKQRMQKSEFRCDLEEIESVLIALEQMQINPQPAPDVRELVEAARKVVARRNQVFDKAVKKFDPEMNELEAALAKHGGAA